MKRLGAVLALLVLAACGGSDEPDWSDYPPQVRDRVESAVDSGDCQEMQREFDATTGSELLSFLDDAMREAGCFE